MTVNGYFGAMAETTSNAGFFKISDCHTYGRFKPSAKLTIRQILPLGVILVDFLGCKYSRRGGWWGDCSFRVWSEEMSLFFPLYCLKLAKDIRSSISPIWLDCSIGVHLNFPLRKHEKLNILLPQFFCVYTSQLLIDTYSSFCAITGGEIFFA